MQKIKLLFVAPFAAAAVIAACGGDKPTPPAAPSTDMVPEAGADMPSTPDTSSAAAAASAAPTDTAAAAATASAAPADTSMAATDMDAGAADAGKGKGKKGGKGDKKGH